MIEIYRRAFRYYLSSLPILLGFSAAAEILVWYLEPKHSNAMLLAPILIIIYYFHRHFLFGERLMQGKIASDTPPQKFGWFFLISFVLMVIPFGLGLLFTFSVAPDGASKPTLYGTMLITFFLLYLVVLSLFGTALPASVARRGNYNLLIGMRMWLGTMWRLIVGPVVTQVLVFGIIIGCDYLLRDIPAYGSTAGQLTLGIFASTLGFLPSLLGVAVLCHMYEKVLARIAVQN